MTKFAHDERFQIKAAFLLRSCCLQRLFCTIPIVLGLMTYMDKIVRMAKQASLAASGAGSGAQVVAAPAQYICASHDFLQAVVALSNYV